MSVDSIGNFLTSIRNGLMASKRFVTVPFSREKLGIAKILKDEGYIKDYQQIENETKKPLLKVFLKYVNGESVISEIVRVSTPGCRKYENSKNLTSVIGGLGISILTTNRGIMTDKQAKQMLVGGEVICHIW